MPQNPSGISTRELRVLATIRESFETAISSGEECSIEERLELVSGRLLEPLLQELLECELRVRGSAASDIDHYLRRFPDFESRVRTVFENRNGHKELLATSDDESGSVLDATRVFDREELNLEAGQPTSATPDQIDRYVIEETLGHGGMGVVYRARDAELKRSVALKMILLGSHAGDVQRQRFRTEAEAVARLHHPNIVQVYELGNHEGSPFLALELVDGGNLADIIGDNAWDPVLSAELCAILARAVHYAHQQGVVHRDLKPGNVLLNRTGAAESPTLQGMSRRPSDSTAFDGEGDTVRAMRGDLSQASGASLEGSGTMSNGWTPKVADFGLARTTDTQDITATGELLGTPKYMAPEQARGERGGPPCDIYALGCILYRLLTGRTPFHGATAVETLRRVVEDVPVSPRVLQPGLSVDLTTICLKCLEKDPQQRYVSARDLADDLTRFLSGELIQARPASTLERFVKWTRRRPAVATLSFALIAVAVTGFALIVWQWRKAVDLADRNSSLVEQSQRSLNDAVRLADQRREIAGREKTAREEAEQLREVAERQLGLANTARLAAQSNSVRAKNPVLSLLLALESASSMKARGEPIQPETFETLIGSVATVGGLPLTGHSKPVEDLAFTADERWLATASWDATVRVWDLAREVPGDAPLVMKGHREEVNSAVFAQDGRWLITGSNDDTVRVWDLSDHESIQCLLVLPHPGDVLQVAVTADGRWLATGGKGVAVYDLESSNIEESRRLLNGPQRTVRCLHWTPDGLRLLAAGEGDRAFVWEVKGDAVSVEPVQTLATPGATCLEMSVAADGSRFGIVSGAVAVAWQLADLTIAPAVLGHSAIVTDLSFSPDGNTVVTTCGDATCRRWNLTAGNATAKSVVLRGHDHYAAGVDISPDGRWAATAAADAQIRLWDLHSTAREPSSLLLPGHRGFLNQVKFSPDGRWLVTGGWDQMTRAWDMTKNLPTHSPVILRGPTAVNAADLSADDRWLAVGYGSGAVAVWDLEEPAKAPVQFREHKRRILNTKISGDGRWIVTSSDDLTARLLDRESGQPPELLSEGLTRLGSVAVSSNGACVATGLNDGTILLRDLSDSGKTRILKGLPAPAGSLAFHDDGRVLAMGCRNGSVAIVELSSPDTVRLSPHHHDGHVRNLSFVDGDCLVSFGGHEAAIWNYESKESPRVFRNDEVFATSGVSPSGRWLAAGGWDTRIRLWDCESGRDEPLILNGHSGAIDGCVISADDRWLVTSSRDETVMMWDLTNPASASPIVLHGHSGMIGVAMFTHQGNRLITGGNGATVRIWDLNIDSLMKSARAVAGRELTPQERRQYLKSATEQARTEESGTDR